MNAKPPSYPSSLLKHGKGDELAIAAAAAAEAHAGDAPFDSSTTVAPDHHDELEALELNGSAEFCFGQEAQDHRG